MDLYAGSLFRDLLEGMFGRQPLMATREMRASQTGTGA
jgi:hypothetical protein